MTWLLVAGALAIFAGLIAVVAYLLRRNRDLRTLLQVTQSNLEHVQQVCARLAPAGVVQGLIAGGADGQDEFSAERKEVTVLFVDLVGYTDLSERLDPDILVRIVNGYYQRISEAVHAHHGQVGSYLGDGIVAYFGALQPNPWQCQDAVRAGLEMCEAIDAYDLDLSKEGLPQISIGVGIDFGRGVAGLVGSEDRKEYSLLGRPVNVAARVQALTRLFGTEILVTEAVREKLGSSFDLIRMPPQAVKGIAQPVTTYAVDRARKQRPV